MTPLSDQAHRDRIAAALDETQVVEAAAGTGKTTALVGRILRVIASGVNVANIVAVTFTEKAAGELKLRLREEIEKARRAAQASGDTPALQAFEEALGRLEEAHVSTIHTFCADLLRERPVEARVDPQFTVLTEGQSERLYNEAFRTWLHGQLIDPRDGVRRSLRRTARRNFGRDIDEDGPVERLRQAGWTLLQWRDHPAPWSRDDDWQRDRAIDALLDAVQRLGALAEQASWREDPVFRNLAALRAMADEIARARREGPLDYDGWEASLVDLSKNRELCRHKGGRQPYGRGISRDQILSQREAVVQALAAFREAADADLASRLHGNLQDLIESYGALKRAQGTLDFLDLLILARDLVRDNAAVRREFQRRFTRLFVDEFQDTDPLQAEILVLLAADERGIAPAAVPDWRDVPVRSGALFIVGDPKQSIYRFRRADVGIYREVRQRLVAGGAVPLTLQASFRSTPAIQRMVNAAFALVMTDDPVTLQAPYVPLDPVRPDPSRQPSVLVLPVPAPYGRTRKVTAYAVEDSLPAAVGGLVSWLIGHSGWHVTERAGADPVPIEARHICLLFRRFTSWREDVTRPYVDALEWRGISHLLVGGKAFHDREEVETLRLALTAIEWPDDELSVYGTLRGALFGVGEEELLEYRFSHAPLHPFRVPAALPAHLVHVGEALGVLRELHHERNMRPVADTVTRLLAITRAHVGLVLRSAGEQALANVLHLAELARQYEADGGISFRGFVEELREAAGREQAPEAPILEEGSDGVRLMTVHKAKGLEFPVVILADITAKLRREEAGRYLDVDAGRCAVRIAGLTPKDLIDHEVEERNREEAEGVRLAYVAATRARDLLVIPAIGDGPYEGGWISPTNVAVYPAPRARRDAAEPAGCPTFGKDTVLERPDGDPARADTMCPGRHTMGDGAAAYDVVWWDPSVLDLSATPHYGLKREDLIAKEVAPAVVEGKLRAYRDWQQGRDSALEQGSRASLDIRTAGEWARSGDPLPGGLLVPDVTIVTLARAATYPTGRRFGTLLHVVLAAVPLGGDLARVDDLAAVHGHLLGAPAEEIAAAAALTRTVLAHPVMLEAAAAERSGACRREVPVTYRCPDGSLVEGVVDLAFGRGDAWVVVDFKTDRVVDTALDTYRRQVGLYAAAVSRATGASCDGILVVA